MPRPPRLLLSKSFYHVMARGNNRMPIFRDGQDYARYLSLIERFKVGCSFDLFHYCLMPNHLHLLVQTKSAHDFATFMKQVSLAYYHYFRKKYGWVGHFWQGRYKSQPVGKDDYFVQCGKYIELNPVRAGLVAEPYLWLWSSYHYYVKGQNNSLLAEDMFYAALGPSKEARQLAYAALLITDPIHQSYVAPVWGQPTQRYNEQQKITRHTDKRRNVR